MTVQPNAKTDDQTDSQDTNDVDNKLDDQTDAQSNKQSDDPTADTLASDSYDAHIIPSETAARKEREGDDYKHIPEHAENGNVLGGYTVDKEGLTNNYATEPEIYYETRGDLDNQTTSTTKPSKYTIVDIFNTKSAAENIVLKMREAGLDTHKISILGQDYQDTEHVQGNLSWQYIEQAEGFSSVLINLGIETDQAMKYESDIKSGKFVVMVIGSDEDINEANQILHAIGHRTLAEVTP